MAKEIADAEGRRPDDSYVTWGELRNIVDLMLHFSTASDLHITRGMRAAINTGPDSAKEFEDWEKESREEVSKVLRSLYTALGVSGSNTDGD